MGKKKDRHPNRIKVLCLFLSLSILILFCSFTYIDNVLRNQVRALLVNYYVDKLPDSILNKPTVAEMIRAINVKDPYTKYFTPQKYLDFVNNIDNKSVGIGVNVEKDDNGLKVTSVIKGTPAEANGIQIGDIIISANGETLAGMSVDQATSYINGNNGGSVSIRVQRDVQYFDITMQQNEVDSPTVESKVIDGHIGYISLISFGNDTADLFKKQLYKLMDNKKVDSYIFDLRFNGGGRLDQALNIAGYFIGNKTALITRDRLNGVIKYPGVVHERMINKKTIFLVNGFTASASEVLTGVAKDYKKGFILGTRTFGKGCIQKPIQLYNGDMLVMTVGDFYSPNDKIIQKVGIKPDVIVNDTVDSLKTAELMLDSKTSVSNTNGYIKLNIKGFGNVIINSARAKTTDYWGAYSQLLYAAASENGIMIGNGRSWNKVKKTSASEIADLYFPGYRMLPSMNNVDINSEFSIKFSEGLLGISANEKTVQLIDEATGMRIPCSINVSGTSLVNIVPFESLKYGATYYLVSNPTLKKANYNNLGYGMIDVIRTASK